MYESENLFLGFTNRYMHETEKSIWHDEFKNYLVNPLDNRTYDEFAKSVNISTVTLWRYRKTHENELQSFCNDQKSKTIDAMRNIAYKSLAAKLASKDTNALKLFFQLSGDLVERQEIKTEHLTREEKLSRLGSALSPYLSNLIKQSGADVQKNDLKADS